VRSHEPAIESRDRTEETHHERIRRIVVDVVRSPDLLNPTTGKHDDVVRDVHRLFLIMRDEHGRHVHLVVQPTQPRTQFLAHLRIECAERLVKQQHLRLDRECARKGHPLPLAAGELSRIAVGELFEMDEFEQLGDALSDLRLRPLADL
jgi:hypothetical protein